MIAGAPKPHNLYVDPWSYAMWRSGRIRHFVRRQGRRLMARGERLAIYQHEPRLMLQHATIARLDRIELHEDIALINGLRIGEREMELLAYNAGHIDYAALYATLSRHPYEGILIQPSPSVQ